ncbi:hypothetical protein BJ322DRAFT_1067469 [Thelephora terrestris]|uniref:Uncharacterized protein n=1 Tax=Thelephora terrestris TaxID=56493 RepID=A0A9P6L5T4_9AGAM|nr:hypothetical protein BJ322DRAFT_1067469 [Thelephora terrestris]
MDDVLGYIPLDREGRKLLIACASVATWWARPSQRRLFSSVSLDDENYLQRMEDVSRDSGGYLSALHNLRSLTLCNITLLPNGQEEILACFSAFRETLTELSLERISASFSSFVSLVGYFPNITTLRVEFFAWDYYESPVPPLSQPLRGEIYIRFTEIYWWKFIDQFTMLNQKYDRLVLDFGSIVVDAKNLESLLQSSASSVKYLQLEATPRRGTALTSIANFRQLREFEPLVNWFGNVEGLIAPISSTKLRKLVISGSSVLNRDIFTQGTEAWGPLDKELCQLVTRLGRAGYRRSLEVELRPSKIRDGDFRPRKIDFTRVLPKFRERGFVTIAYRNACDSNH